MFGAYQAGVWSVLADCFKPDLVVGASIGAVNGWAIAGGATPEQLIDRWMTLDCASTYRWQVPKAIHGGFLDCRPLRALIDEIYFGFQPRTKYALVATDLARLQPRIFRDAEVTSDLLKASTAIPCVFEQVRIGDRVYSDGGLLSALPVWAAVELGAGRIVAVDALTTLPGLIPKVFVRIVRSFSRFRPTPPAGLDMVKIAPAAPLGSGVAALCWSKENALRWIEMGRRDALAQRHSIQDCFERK